MTHVPARMPPEVGELLLKALEAAEAQLEEPAGAADSNAVAEDVSAETPPTQPALITSGIGPMGEKRVSITW